VVLLLQRGLLHRAEHRERRVLKVLKARQAPKDQQAALEHKVSKALQARDCKVLRELQAHRV
jgi:hypothetical protein